MANGAPDHTLQPTALVREGWLRLIDKDASTSFGLKPKGTIAESSELQPISKRVTNSTYVYRDISKR
jgi:hypothetical protein